MSTTLDQSSLPSKLTNESVSVADQTSLEKEEISFPGAASSEDNAVPTNKWELYAYYLYYVGNSGLGPFNFQPTQYQNLLYLAGSNIGTSDSACDGSVTCVLPFAGNAMRDINSIVLVTNGISFAIQVVLFLFLGSYADYGTWRRWILIVFTVASIAISFAWLGCEDPDKWLSVGTTLYIVGLIGYQGALTFWTAAFPLLARSLPEMIESKAQLDNGEISQEQHTALDSLSRNRLSNVSFAVSSLGELIILIIGIGVLKGINSDDNNTAALSIFSAYSGGWWLVCAIPWFLIEKKRVGLSLPPGQTYFTIGYYTLWQAFKEARKLKDTMIYLVFYFLMSDVLNTAVTVISILQYNIVSYNTLTLNYLLMVGIATQGAGIYIFWLIQKRYGISTKAMFVVVCGFIMLLVFWGMIGNWTDKFGFKTVGEIWAYQALYGLVVCPWYSYSQTMISEVIPPGKEFLFFALFSIAGKTSALIGPLCTAQITAATNNVSASFYFLFGLGAVSCVLLYFLDITRSRIQCKEYLAKEKMLMEAASGMNKSE